MAYREAWPMEGHGLWRGMAYGGAWPMEGHGEISPSFYRLCKDLV